MTNEQLFEIYQSNYKDLQILSTPASKEIKELEQLLRKEYEDKFKQQEKKIDKLRNMLDAKVERVWKEVNQEETDKRIVEALRHFGLVTTITKKKQKRTE